MLVSRPDEKDPMAHIENTALFREYREDSFVVGWWFDRSSYNLAAWIGIENRPKMEVEGG
jgi:hypothetical protein